jgi:hypothetical protein
MNRNQVLLRWVQILHMCALGKNVIPAIAVFSYSFLRGKEKLHQSHSRFNRLLSAMTLVHTRNFLTILTFVAATTAPTYSTTMPGLPSSSTPIATPSAQYCCSSATLSAPTATNNPPLVCGSTSQGKASLRPRVISFS